LSAAVRTWSTGGVNDGLVTTTAQTLVPGDRETVFGLIESLSEHLWPGATHAALSRPPAFLVHTVTDEVGGIAAWLTWELASIGTAGWTLVRLIHDEADLSPGPPPELEILLTLLAESASARATR